MNALHDLKNDMQKFANPEKGKFLHRFFKTGKGEYAEGDVFLGLTVPQSRAVAKRYVHLLLEDVKKLLISRFHEERLVALIILIAKYKKADSSLRKEIYEFYLSHTAYINNWDLVDISAEYIVGDYLLNQSNGIAVLKKLSHSSSLWERRIAIIATFAWIKKGETEPTHEIAKLLLHDKHDLIHKAVGWMLREAGKRVSESEEEIFLTVYYKSMPRTMLRYAIERFPEEKRKKYLLGEI